MKNKKKEKVVSKRSIFSWSRWIFINIKNWDLYKWLVGVSALLAILNNVASQYFDVHDPPPPIEEFGVVDHTQDTRSRTEGFRQRNGHCTEPTYPLFSFYASEGWTIDRTSVVVRCSNSSKSTCNGLRNVTERSFTISCTVANNGFCIPPIIRDGRGACWGEVEWTEQRSPDASPELGPNDADLGA